MCLVQAGHGTSKKKICLVQALGDQSLVQADALPNLQPTYPRQVGQHQLTNPQCIHTVGIGAV